MSNTYDIFTGSDLAVAEKILQRRSQMLIHSCLYYEMDTNLISDRQWDMWAKELVQLQKDYPEISKQINWYEDFKDWDGTTGAFLPLKNEWVIRKAKQIAGIRNSSKTSKPKEKPKGQLTLF